ncbi:hypothetical protein NCU02547 [Neurospora crassa OR74A]|uniref:Thioredoxin-like fold domain-containing protein n=1 Tax=Neurospora crassa (strain ATCC 24698 / 74-OR23-1A / CBS 708.71 / DSM 1257 / FGSC 987) TaxID=367110 RepID=V5IQS2_NEUCR|nr:hypothetical protein NCU02547 [Neurospora crassa OR74A]ESA43909.1 hypothetical protein NCU02547 [Neurospora crassa OR74A]|eukprot:XP_011392964.1 hypothetical protein NCU02547 [Neurospora crassa OR74A]
MRLNVHLKKTSRPLLRTSTQLQHHHCSDSHLTTCSDLLIPPPFTLSHNPSFTFTSSTMALPPKFAGHRFIPTEGAGASSFPTQPLHTVEIFLDYVCPFSAKIYNTLYTTLLPSLRSEHADLGSKVQFIFRHQIQPWHPSSTLTHEAGLAVQRLAPTKFWDFSAALFKDQKAYFDVSLVNETRNETYKRLAKLASQSAGVDEKELYELLAIPTEKGDDGSLNVGNAVTNDLKTVIKMARLVGVHVSPTVIFDGVVAGEVSSSWTLEQWLEYLRKSVA